MYCAGCGAENAAGARHCVSCGAGLSAHCLACEADLPAGARFCPACGQPAKASDSKPSGKEPLPVPQGERRQVTVLFADLAGFTSFVHKSDAEDVRDLLDPFWARLDGIIATHGGMTEKHIGDAILALFGARQAREDDPVQAVRTALEIQAFLSEHAPDGGLPLQMRIGVHTGMVVVGPLGSSGEFAATGDAVNLANRLEQNAPVGGVLLSQETYRHVYGLFDVQAMPPLDIKGRTEPIQTYLVQRAKPKAVAALLRGVEGVPTEMVGREAELNLLKAALQKVIDTREIQTVTIVGEAGIGKSCLLREFQKWVELIPHRVRLFYGRATAEMAGRPFSLIRDMFCTRFEIQDSDPAALARSKLEQGLVEMMKARNQDDPALVEEWRLRSRFIGQLLGLDFSASPGLREVLADPDQVRHRAFHYLSQFFEVISQKAPSAPGTSQAELVVAEDIHWSDEGSLDLLGHLARSNRGVPLLLVCLARPLLLERHPAWGQGLTSEQRLKLEPLSRLESRALVGSILRKTPEIPQALRELVVGGAEGIPFFIEEIIKMLIDQKVIVPGVEQWLIEPARLAAARVPATLTGVLQARLDGLTPVERAVLQRASVIGRVFWDSAVERLTSAAGPGAAMAGVELPVRQELTEALAGLRRKELILRREGSAFAGAVEFMFKHELLRNVAYESLLKKLRREYHAEVAAWLIERSGERSNEFAGSVAVHFEQAGRPELAAEWYGRAGQQARAGYAPVTAIEAFSKALSLLTESGLERKRLEWQEGLGDALGAQARFAEALAAFERLRALAESLGDGLVQARAWNGLAFLQERLGKNRASVESAERAEMLARAAGTSGRSELVRALHLKGWAFYRLSDAPAVLALGDQTARLCQEFGDRRGLATSFKLHGVAHLQLGHFDEADHFFQQGLALCEELGDRRNTAAMFNNLGESARARGDFQAAAILYEKALALARQIGHRESEIVYLGSLSAARLGLQQFREVEEDLREALAITTEANTCALAESYTVFSEACLAQSKLQEALDAARRGLSLALESENDLFLGNAWCVLGQVVAALQRAGAELPSVREGVSERMRPEDCFAQSLRVFRKINARCEQARTLRAWAQFELQNGRNLEGRRKADEARAMFVRLGAAFEVDRTDALLGRTAQNPAES